MKDTAIIWFRNDLRIHDNEALTKAITDSNVVIPVYIFDERIFNGKTKFGFRKTDIFRTKFIIESIICLRKKLQKLGLDLLVAIGKPEDIIFNLAKENKSSWVYANRERTAEEVEVQDALEANLWTIGQEMIYTRGKMLYYTSDLPFPITQTPDIFTNFRKEVEKFIPVRKPLPIPEINYCQVPNENVEWGEIPTLEDFGHDINRLSESNLKFEGGEDVGLRQLRHYLWDTDLIANYKESRNGLLGWDFSSKFSPYISQGCLSPKLVYHEIKRYESERKSNDSTYWMTFEFLWRDYFRLVGKKYGNLIFKKGGIVQKTVNGLCEDRDQFQKWADGNTGIPFIDANMVELNKTGFMSNRGRQNVASFLVHDLKLNWQMGAEYFESLLLDYDPCSNYGNWIYISGVGNDPREDRYFNVVSQGRRYDDQADFIKHWLPNLQNVPNDLVHEVYNLNKAELTNYNVILGENYPRAMINLN